MLLVSSPSVWSCSIPTILVTHAPERYDDVDGSLHKQREECRRRMGAVDETICHRIVEDAVVERNVEQIVSR